MDAIRVENYGGPEQMEWSPVPDPSPGPGEALVTVLAAGVNYIDTYHRTGLYPVELPFTPGLEGAGVVRELGDGVEGIEMGDRVAWSGCLGSYAEQVVGPADRMVPVPPGIEIESAAGLLLQGITAYFLANATFRLSEGDRALVHAGAGGVGLLLIQLAKRRGAEVFTTVGSAEKGRLAESAGADHVILYRETDFAEAVEEIAGPRPLDVVYDGVGAATFDRGLTLLRPRGMMITFGNASGPVPPVAPLRLTQEGSLYLTRPTMGDYMATRAELLETASSLFEMVISGELSLRIGHSLPMRDAARAHRMLEGRETTGKVILTP
ncbi:MAG: quinone oxidoreductase [bacterium]|nr:quinone oxidoreductase [bacterium]MDE0600654.1 quinone oxidoreductase [bacterium]